MVNSRESLAKIPSMNNDANPYIITLDIYKEGYWAYDISNYYKGRVDDNGTPFMVRWFEHGQLKNVQGLRPFIRGTVGQHTVDDQTDPDNPKVVPSPDCSQIDQTGETTDTAPGGIAIYRMVNQCFTQEGMFYGEIGLKDSSGIVLSSVDIAFKVLGGRMNMLGARKFYVSELEKALTDFKAKFAELQKDFEDKMDEDEKNYQSKMDSNEQDFNARMTTELQNLQDHVNSYLSQYEGAVKYNIASLDHLASVASSIDAELKAADVANKQDFDNLKKDIVTKLSQMQLTPTVVTNLQELSTKYPKGAMGVFVTADDGCIAFFDGSQWQKGAKFEAAGLSLNSEKQISENNEVTKALLDKHNGQVVYSFHASPQNTTENGDSNFLRITKLPNGVSQFIFAIQSKIGSNPIVVFAEKQDDGSYISKSAAHLTTPTGNIDSTLINYAVNNDNTYLFLGGSAYSFKFSMDKSEGTNPFIQLSPDVPFNSPVKPLHDENTDTNLNLAGVDITVIGLKPFEEPFLGNYSNFYLDSAEATKDTADHFWSIGDFNKNDYLTKVVLKSTDLNSKIEIREKIDNEFVLKKTIKPYKKDDHTLVFYLNYLADNNGQLFLHGKFNFDFSNYGQLYEYDGGSEKISIPSTSETHAIVVPADIFRLKNPNFAADLIDQITSSASEEAFNKAFNKSGILLFSNLDKKLDQVPGSSFKNHFWNAMNFHRGEFISKVILKTTDPNSKVEIRENINNEYVLKKRVGVSITSSEEAEADVDYEAQNDGILFVSGIVAFSTSDSSEPLYEYDETDDPIHLTSTPGVSAYDFGIAVYSSNLPDSIMSKTISKISQDTEEDQTTKTKNRFTNLSNTIPRLQKIDKSFGLLGRWYIKKIANENYYVTNNDGAQIYFKISNASYFDINWKQMYNPDYARWAYAIDDGNFNSISTSQTRVDIPNKDTHIIRVVTDAINQEIGKWDLGNGFAFNKLSTDGTIAGLTPVDPVIMYFGDSITEGIRTLGMDANGPGCSVLHAYSWLSAQNLHAHPYLVGYGATGLYSKGSFNTNDYSVDWMTQGIAEKEIQPNLIVVNIGTNDGGINDDGFKDLYKSFVHKLFLKYPGVPIACMIPFNQIHANPITEVVSEAKDCFLIPTQGWDLTFTDGTHPDQAGSVKAAYNLAKAIQEQIGNTWQSHVLPEQSMDLSKLNS